MRLRLAHIVSLASLVAFAATGAPSDARAEPPQFGVEVEGSSGAGLTPYLRNEVRTEEDQTETDDQDRYRLRPFLVDEQTGVGNGASARLVASNITAGLSLQWFELPEERVHHRGDETISPDRVRPDGTVDDSGVAYDPVDPPTEDPVAESARDTLLVFGLGGDYRFTWTGEMVDFFIPAGGGLVLTHVTRDASPFRLGAQLASGLGARLDLGAGLALVASGKLHALATPHYGRRSDAAYRSATIGESTESAYFSTLLYGTANLALQFQIR